MRECGPCTLCCTTCRMPDFDKPENVTCQYCDQGCTIHATRPDCCREWFCGWMMGDMDETMRPDLSHIVIEILPKENLVFAMFESGHQNALIEHEQALREAYVDNGVSVIASNGYGLIAEGVIAEQIREDFLDAAREMKVI